MCRQSVVLIFFLLCNGPVAETRAQGGWQNPEAEQLYTQARAYLSNGKLAEAIGSYKSLIPLADGKVVVYRELAQAYHLSGNDEQALSILNPVLERDRADEPAYALMAEIYTAQKDTKKSKGVLQKGLKKFPASGLLHHAVGKQYEAAGDMEGAVKAYVTGIHADAQYHVNYYDAARMYVRSNQLPWAILYAEIFINLEQETARSADARRLLLGAYKRLFLTPAGTGDAIQQFGKDGAGSQPGDFQEAVRRTYLGLAPVVADGFDVENLIMLRARFLAAWPAGQEQQYPFSLFSYWRALLVAGQFDAYNQWLLGKAISEQEYTVWTNFHQQNMPAFSAWHAANPYRPMPADPKNPLKTAGLFKNKK